MSLYSLSNDLVIEVKFNHKYKEVPIKKRGFVKQPLNTVLFDKANLLGPLSAEQISEISCDWENQSVPTEVKPYETSCEIIFRYDLSTDRWRGIPNQTFFSVADCHKNDNFSKLKGRKVSFSKALKQTHVEDGPALLDKLDREELFFMVFPQYRVWEDTFEDYWTVEDEKQYEEWLDKEENKWLDNRIAQIETKKEMRVRPTTMKEKTLTIWAKIGDSFRSLREKVAGK